MQKGIDMKNVMDLAQLLSDGTYSWQKQEQDAVWALHHVIFCENPVSNHFQSMNIFVPAPYLREDGSIDPTAEVNGYTPSTAPVVFRNNCSGWMSSDPDMDRGAFTVKDCAQSGYVYVSCGARSRDLGRLGKMPAPVVDLKAGVRFLRLNADVLPGCMDRIVSIGGSGAGEMSSVIGASGNHPDYLPWLYEIGAAGVVKNQDGSFGSTIRDDVMGCMCFYPITDIENADLAYAWTRFDSGEKQVKLGGGGQQGTAVFTPFKLAFQQDMAECYAGYINELALKSPEGEILGFPVKEGKASLREGAYYERILGNLSDALNRFLSEEKDADVWVLEHYGIPGENGEKHLPDWLKKDKDYQVTDMSGFLRGTGLARNKDIPGFDTFWKTAENNAFGGQRETAVHYSLRNAEVLRKNDERYRGLEGYGACDVESYMREPENENTRIQTKLMNSTHLLLENARKEKKADVSPFWRIRSGTADEHTGFSVGYNLALAASENSGVQVDYSLVWNMRHGGEVEGTSAGTFLSWTEGLFK